MSLPSTSATAGSAGSKRIVSLRSPTIIPSHHMPMPTGTPWNVADMTWSVGPQTNLMEFNAGSPMNILGEPRKPFQCKRKADIDFSSPNKQLITEEKMAAHLNGLHISSDYTSHSGTTEAIEQQMDSGERATRVHANLTKDLEEKLRNAQRITVCEEIRKLEHSDTIIPKIFMDRIEKPCTALVLWQPPKPLNKLIKSRMVDPINMYHDEEEDNNNSSDVDLNSMDLDM